MTKRNSLNNITFASIDRREKESQVSEHCSKKNHDTVMMSVMINLRDVRGKLWKTISIFDQRGFPWNRSVRNAISEGFTGRKESQRVHHRPFVSFHFLFPSFNLLLPLHFIDFDIVTWLWWIEEAVHVDISQIIQLLTPHRSKYRGGDRHKWKNRQDEV